MLSFQADVVSPLMHSHSWAVRRGSLTGETDLLERNSLHKKVDYHKVMITLLVPKVNPIIE